jgi:hypothetical protein
VARNRTGAERRIARSVDHGEMRGGRSRGEERRGEYDVLSICCTSLLTSISLYFQVMIAQERMSNNHVYVFKKQQPSKFEWVCETRWGTSL